MKKVIFLLILCSNIIFGDLGKFKGWEKTWVKHLLTIKELKEFKKIKTEKEAEIFISNFWKKRDPTPKTEENEFKERCENLAKYADKEFSTKNQRGSETDRGKFLLLLGHPSFIKRQVSSLFKEKEEKFTVDNFDYEIEDVVHSLEGGQMEYENIVYEIWIYKREILPFEMPSSNLLIFFRKEKEDFYFQLNQINLREILEKAKEQYIIEEE